jgi:hypothetical protein
MPIPAIAAAAGISALGSIASSIFGNSGRRRAEARAHQRNVQFWNMQNSYNHPSAQMARLREAGLNPNMIYGTSPTSAVGQAGKVDSVQPAKFEFGNPLANINDFANFKQSSAQTDNLKAQNDLILQETALKGAQTAETAQRGAKTKVEAELAQELKETSLQAGKENLRQLEARTLQIDLDNQFKSQVMKDQIKEIFYRAENAKQTLRGIKLSNELKVLEKDLRSIGIERNDPWYFRVLGRGYNQLKQ